ncbi:MAG TPA: hypothetical protein VGL66_13165 [Caulobacteraceae bacterium]|jgi:hypothetical protein
MRLKRFSLALSVLSLITSACGHHVGPARDEWGDPKPTKKAAGAQNLMDCKRGFTILVNAAASAEGSSVVQAPTTTNLSAFQVSNASEQAMYTITLPQHPAYPMIVHRVFHQTGKKISIDMDACPFGDKTASLALYQQFHDLDAKIMGQAAKPTDHPHRGRHRNAQATPQ